MAKQIEQYLWESGIVEFTVIQTIIVAMKMTNKESLTIDDLETICKKIKERKNE